MRSDMVALVKLNADTEKESAWQCAADWVRKGATGTMLGRQTVRMGSRAAMSLYLCFFKRCTRSLLQPSRGLGMQEPRSPPKMPFWRGSSCTTSQSHPSGCSRNGSTMFWGVIRHTSHQRAAQWLYGWLFSSLRVANSIARDTARLGATLKHSDQD